MSTVPGCDQATIEPTKIANYFLSGRHPIGWADGREPLVSTVWMVRHGETIPHFVTAFPC